MSEVQHETIYYSGRVQGVGFRYLTAQVAREFEVAGIVSNLADGRVHLEVESSSPDEIKAFLAAIDERMHGYIRKVDRIADKREPHFRGFEIR